MLQTGRSPVAGEPGSLLYSTGENGQEREHCDSVETNIDIYWTYSFPSYEVVRPRSRTLKGTLGGAQGA